ncbi:MAG: penicillin acylase family protein [Deltaproteobacteria bacterium]|nr:penicillin acylase family protein [Deltaproteobacteria bacterium]
MSARRCGEGRGDARSRLLGAGALALVLGWGCGGDTAAPDASDASDTSDASDLADTTDLPDGADAAGPDATFDATAARALLESVPETARFTLPDLRSEAFVVRTEASIPHIYAASREDLGRVLGFVLARDRFFIMDLQRRLALGTITELLGDLALGNDREARLTGMTRVTDQMLAALPPEDGAFLDACAAGVNAYIDAVKAGTQPLPSELEIAGAFLGSEDPSELMAPFDRRSMVAMAAVIVYETTFEGGDVERAAKDARLESAFDGVEEAALRSAGARADIWERLEPVFPVASAAGFGVDVAGLATRAAPSRAAAPSSAAAPGPVDAVAQPHAPLALLTRTGRALAALRDRLGKRSAENFGSNTWAVSGAHTPDGAALVAGDGHLQLDVPALMFQVGMDTQVLGGGDIHQAGLLITGIPVLGVGTNGRVAWSQVNPVIDTTDWYLEELVLDSAGLPQATRFEGETRALVPHAESHTIADLPLLGSEGRVDTWTRYETFDGRMLTAVEGRALADDEDPATGEAVVVTLSGRVVPGDQDGDGVVSAISFDYTAFDATYIHGSIQAALAKDVREYQDATRGFIGNALYSTAADADGSIIYTSYQAVPCRTYLPRGAGGRWLPGADPTELLDGTRFRGFTVPSLPDGTVDEGPGAEDPYRCVVPFAETPQSIDPPQGYVVNANNQPAPVQNDGTLWDDRWYLGGPWVSVRADTISQRLEAAIARDDATIAEMASIQADKRSRTAELFVPFLLDALDHARAAQASDDAAEMRLAALHAGHADAMDEAGARLAAWRDRGYVAASGVETFYETPDETARLDAVAAMIFNAWLPRMIDAVIGDEPLDDATPFNRNRARAWAVLRFLRGRGPTNPEALASWKSDTGESVFFDRLGTPEVERSDEDLLAALGATLDWLSGPPAPQPGRGGFGTEDMSAWLWGLRHQVRFESILASQLPDTVDLSFITDSFAISTETLPLMPSYPPGDPRAGLRWFPRGGDNFTVDAASPGFSGTDFTYADGPVMRMVIALRGGRVTGQNIIPGGQSALVDSPYFADQAALWLGNQTLPLRFHAEDVKAGATGREVYVAP